LLERTNLNRVLDELKGNRVIAVRAPAGYGKTTAISQWFGKGTFASAIFSADEFDNSPTAFCEHFCEALRALQPQNKNLSMVTEAVVSENLVSENDFRHDAIEITLRAISTLTRKKRTVLAIDDLHLVHSDEIFRLLRVFIKRLPCTFQIILISRHRLPPIFSDLWLKGELSEISTEQLAFSEEESEALYQNIGNRAGYAETEGWPIGINAVFIDDEGLLYDYIQINVWFWLDDTARDFMLRTANLRELTPSLCEAMTGISHSEMFLRKLVQEGAFVSQDKEGVFRYHSMFKKFLVKKLDEQGEEFARSLLEKEGAFHLARNDFYDAAECFIRCKNYDGINKAFGLLDAGFNATYAAEKLLPIFKHAEVRNAVKDHPRILFFIVWSAFIEGRVNDAVEYMDEYYDRWLEIAAAYPDSAYNILYMRVLDFRVTLHHLLSEFKAITIIEGKYLITLPNAFVFAQMPQMHRGIVDYSEAATGNTVENFSNLISEGGWLYGEASSVMAETIVSGLLYEQGFLEEAQSHAINAIAEVKTYFPPELKFCAMTALAMVNDDVGSDEPDFYAINARRKISKGIKSAAIEWLESRIPIEEPNLLVLFDAFNTARAYIVLGEYISAAILLKKILTMASEFRRTVDLLEAQVLLAISFWKMKRDKEAMEFLQAAVNTARPFGYVQMFINDGAVLSGMLHKLKKRAEYNKTEERAFIDFIKMLYLKTRPLSAAVVYTEEAVPIRLTEKQRAVMNLLCQGKRYKEAAEILGIKKSSIISHMDLIYKKLEVTNLADAVAKVEALKLV